MRNSDTKEFVEYCYMHWIPKKQTRKFLKLFKEYLFSSVITYWHFVISWVMTLKTSTTTSNLFPWKIFTKVKVYASRKLTSLMQKKW